jgi:CO/xanthine dehydrogenase Mo-binding subunit
MRKEYRHLGKATPRKDAREIVTGEAKFIDDVKLPGIAIREGAEEPVPSRKYQEH